MKLYIDTSDAEEIVVKLDGEEFKTRARENKSQKLLVFMDEILKKKGKKFRDVSEIKVNAGPGSFTGLRVGISVVNAIGWVLGIADPVEPVYS